MENFEYNDYFSELTDMGFEVSIDDAYINFTGGNSFEVDITDYTVTTGWGNMEDYLVIDRYQLEGLIKDIQKKVKPDLDAIRDTARDKLNCAFDEFLILKKGWNDKYSELEVTYLIDTVIEALYGEKEHE